MESWGIVASYTDTFDFLYLWTPLEEVCLLTPDWKTDNFNDNAWGSFVSEIENYSCPYIEEQGWTYTEYTYEEDTNMPISFVGPWGNDWMWLNPEEF